MAVITMSMIVMFVDLRMLFFVVAVSIEVLVLGSPHLTLVLPGVEETDEEESDHDQSD